MKTILELEKPTKLKQIKGYDNHVGVMRKWNDNRSHPHMLLHGPWGTGKSASVDAMLREFYGKNYNYNTVWINASNKEERSIENMSKVIKKMGVKPAGNFPYRIFVFDEADQLTGDAEKSLKEALTRHSKIAKACFISNHPGKIDGGLRGRCKAGTLEFNYMKLETLRELISDIYDRHIDRFSIKMTKEEVLDSIIPDVPTATRDTIDLLEYRLNGGIGAMEDPVMIDLSKSIIKKFVLSIKKPIPKARLYTSVVDMYDEIVASVGNQERGMVKHMFSVVKGKKRFKKYPMEMGFMSVHIAEADINLMESINPSAHMMKMLYIFVMEFGGK